MVIVGRRVAFGEVPDMKCGGPIEQLRLVTSHRSADFHLERRDDEGSLVAHTCVMQLTEGRHKCLIQALG